MGGHLKANMMYYHIYLYHGSKYNCYCVITQTLQNGQTLGQFFELLYVDLASHPVLSAKIPDSTCGEGSDKVEWYLVPTMNLQRRKFIPKKGDLDYNR